MTHRRWSLVFLLVFTTVAASAAGPEPKYRAPRTADGHPDLQGVWNFATGVPLQRPAAFADKKFFTQEEFDKQRDAMRNALGAIAKFAPVENVGLDWIDSKVLVQDLRTSLITYPENGRVPKLLEGVRRVPGVEDFIAILSDSKGGPNPSLLSLLASFGGGKKEGHEDFGMSERCLFGPTTPLLPGLGDNYVQILQGKDHVVLLTDETRRMIALDSRPLPGTRLRSWSGESRGHWEGETLVVETRHLNGRTPSFNGAGTSRDRVVTERFTRGSRNGLEYEATIVDPKTFEDKIVLSFPMARVEARLYESACHEGNYSLSNTLSAARKDEQDAIKTKP